MTEEEVSRLQSQVFELNMKVYELGKEVARLKNGDLTPQEFQNLCHNLKDKNPACPLHDFQMGCVVIQRTLYPTDTHPDVYTCECVSWSPTFPVFRSTYHHPDCPNKGKS